MEINLHGLQILWVLCFTHTLAPTADLLVQFELKFYSFLSYFVYKIAS